MVRGAKILVKVIVTVPIWVGYSFCKSVTFANINSLLSGPCKEKRIMIQLSVDPEGKWWTSTNAKLLLSRPSQQWCHKSTSLNLT